MVIIGAVVGSVALIVMTLVILGIRRRHSSSRHDGNPTAKAVQHDDRPEHHSPDMIDGHTPPAGSHWDTSLYSVEPAPAPVHSAWDESQYDVGQNNGLPRLTPSIQSAWDASQYEVGRTSDLSRLPLPSGLSARAALLRSLAASEHVGAGEGAASLALTSETLT